MCVYIRYMLLCASLPPPPLAEETYLGVKEGDCFEPHTEGLQQSDVSQKLACSKEHRTHALAYIRNSTTVTSMCTP